MRNAGSLDNFTDLNNFALDFGGAVSRAVNLLPRLYLLQAQKSRAASRRRRTAWSS
jgi:hypothetical protein